MVGWIVAFSKIVARYGSSCGWTNLIFSVDVGFVD